MLYSLQLVALENEIAARAAEGFVPIAEPLGAAELPTAEQSPLTAEQLEAVRHLEGPGLVVAGPGSGKTTVLRERLRHLVQERGVEARNILSLAYNRAAKQELIRRPEAIGDFEIDTFVFAGFGESGRSRSDRLEVLKERLAVTEKSLGLAKEKIEPVSFSQAVSGCENCWSFSDAFS